MWLPLFINEIKLVRQKLSISIFHGVRFRVSCQRDCLFDHVTRSVDRVLIFHLKQFNDYSNESLLTTMQTVLGDDLR